MKDKLAGIIGYLLAPLAFITCFIVLFFAEYITSGLLPAFRHDLVAYALWPTFVTNWDVGLSISLTGIFFVVPQIFYRKSKIRNTLPLTAPSVVAVCTFAAFELVGFFVSFANYPVPNEIEKKVYQEACQPVINWLDGTYQVNGQYPENLPDEYCDLLNDLKPKARYRVLKDGQYYYIIIGDYGKYGWEYLYGSEGRRWHTDT